MALTTDEKNTIREIAREINQQVLEQHIASCPHGLLLMKGKACLVGIMLGSCILGGITGVGSAVAVVKIMMAAAGGG